MFRIRPKFRACMAGSTARISAMGVSMFASTARRQSSNSNCENSPCGGPPALVMRISGSGQAANSAARPASVVTSPWTVVTETPVSARIAAAVASSASPPRAEMTSETPSRASAKAQPRPSPLEAAQTTAVRPLMPRSICVSPCDFGGRLA